MIKTSITVDDIMACEPPSGHTRGSLVTLWAGRAALTPLEILDLDIQAEDRVWMVTHPRLTSLRFRRRVACRIARALIWDRLTDPRSRAAVETVERWLEGAATEDEVTAANDDADRAAYDIRLASPADDGEGGPDGGYDEDAVIFAAAAAANVATWADQVSRRAVSAAAIAATAAAYMARCDTSAAHSRAYASASATVLAILREEAEREMATAEAGA